MTARFEDEGFEITETDNGIGGLLEFERFKPDLALLDMDMSGKNGVELCSKIRELSRIPFVMFTATTDVEEQAARTGGGVVKVIMCASHVKPISSISIHHRIARKMIHEFRTYDLKPGSLPQYYTNTAPKMEKRLEYSPLVGYFHTEVGPLNRVLHIWEYEDLNERSSVRSQVIQDGIWPPPNKGIVEKQQVDIFMPAPFVPSFDRNRKIGPLFELRMYRYPVGAIPRVYEAWAPKIEARMSLCEMVGVWSSDIGGLNQLAHMWAYESFEHRTEAREQFASIGWPPDSGVMPISMENMLMYAADFSPIQ